MAEKLPFGEGASINRPPLFCGLNYQFWKVRTEIFVEYLDKGICDAIENGPFIPKFEKDGSFIKKTLVSMDWFWKQEDPNLIVLLRTS